MNNKVNKKSTISYKEIVLWLACTFTCFHVNSIYKITQLLEEEEEEED